MFGEITANKILETHPKCQRCSRLHLHCKYEQPLYWEDDALKRGITFGRSDKARQQRKGETVEDHDNVRLLKSLKEGQSNHTKRKYNLFINSSNNDFVKLYSSQEPVKPSTLISAPVNAKPALIVLSASESVLHKYSQIRDTPLCSISNTGSIVDLHSLALLDEEFRDLSNSIIRSSEDKPLIPFLSNSIPRMFSSTDLTAKDSQNFHEIDSQKSSFQIDGIFLQSFSSPHLAHITRPSSPTLDIPKNPLLLPLLLLALTLGSSSMVDAIHITSLERRLLNYFIEHICPYCVCYPKVSKRISQFIQNYSLLVKTSAKIKPELNPYLYLIVPLSFQSMLVKKAVIAASAKQLLLLGEASYEKTAKTYSYQVLKELPGAINAKQQNKDSNWDDILATMIMLCFMEILANCNSTWLVHLNGAKQFLKESSIRNNLSSVGKFFIRYFISHEVMGETAWVYDARLQSTKPINDDPYIKALKHDTDTKIDLVLGCSPYLLSLIHKISVLGKCYEDIELKPRDKRKSLETEILWNAATLEQCLMKLNQEVPEIEEEDDEDRESRKFVYIIAEIKRLAALIYLHARVYLEYQFYHGNNSNVAAKFEKVKHHTRRIIELHCDLPGNYASLIWPIFIVGVVAADGEEERWFVLDSLTAMGKHRKLRSVSTAKEVVLSLWKDRDLGHILLRWKSIIKSRANTISLA